MHSGIFDVKEERVETESNEAQSMELEAQMFEAERDWVRQSWRENALEERERRDKIKVRDHVRLLVEERWDFTTLV